MQSTQRSRDPRAAFLREDELTRRLWSAPEERVRSFVIERLGPCFQLAETETTVPEGVIDSLVLSQLPALAERPALFESFREFLGRSLLRTQESPRDEAVPLYVRSIPIHDLGSETLDLVAPLQVEVECYDDEVISKVAELDLWASASTEGQAIMAIKNSIIELFEELSGIDNSELGKLPRMWKRILTKMIRRAESAV